MLRLMVCMVLVGLLLGGQSELQAKENKDIVIGVSLPTQNVERWVRNKNNLKHIAKERGVDIIVQMANENMATQIAQVENLITQGVDAIIIGPHDGNLAATCVDRAKQAGIPVISYCRLIMNADQDAHIAFDNYMVGQLQGEYLTKIAPKGNYIVLSGDKGDANSILFRGGAMSKIQPLVDKGDITIVLDQFVKDWQPNNALNLVENALTAYDNDIAGIWCANDGLAGGAIQALAAQGLDGKVQVIGGDAGVDAAKRIVSGKQCATVYRDLLIMDEAAIDVAIKLAKGEDISSMFQGEINNGKGDIPAILPKPELVIADNLDKVLISSGYHKKEDVYAESKQ